MRSLYVASLLAAVLATAAAAPAIPEENTSELLEIASGPSAAAQATNALASDDNAKAAAAAAVSNDPAQPPKATDAATPSAAVKSGDVKGSFVPLLCYVNAAVKDHIYTTNSQELGAGKGDWKPCGTVGLVNADPEEGYDRLYRYLDLTNVDHIYYNKKQVESRTMRPEGFEGYVSSSLRKGMIPLNVFFNKKTRDHILVTTSSYPAGYEKVDTLGYVLPAPAVATTAAKRAQTVKEQPKFWANNPVDPRLAPVFRYWNPALRDHFYTMDYQLLQAGKNGWRYQGIQMYIFPTKVEDSVPMYRWWNVRLGDHFYSTDYYDLGEGRDGYKLRGILGYVRQKSSQGTVPLYRYFNSDIGDHFYTTNTMSKAHGGQEWANEGISGYVYPVPAPAKKGEANPAALQVPLYRYWNKRFSDHFYTTIWAEVDVGTHGWQYQGVQALVYPKQEAGTVPLYRYWNIRTLDHFYTTNFKALGQGGKDGWKYEGIECFVDVYRKSGTVPLYRYFAASLNDHFYTTKWLGRSFKSYVYEGVQAYVHRPPVDDGASGKVKAPAGMSSLYRYWNAATKDHSYTSNWDEYSQGGQGYSLEGVEGYIWKDNSAAGTLALHRYYNPRVSDTFLTTDYSLLKAGGRDGWEYQGVLGYLSSQGGNGLVKLYRYYSKSLADHFYTAEYLGKTKNSYVYQGAAGFMKPHEGAANSGSVDKSGESGSRKRTGKSASVTAKDLKTLYSYYNAKTRDHFFTTNFEILRSGEKGWTFNGAIGKCSAKDNGGSLKLRQYYSKSRKDHRYTIRHVRGGDWTYEGTVCYLEPNSGDGKVKLMNYENRRAMDNALSTKSTGPAHGGHYSYIETLGFVYPTDEKN